jgi:16S rRNA (cytosine1402-N4)-methyltransferase
MESVHKTVLLNETIEGLNLKPNSIILDCTFGGGGHSLEILRRHPKAKVIAIDQDKSAWEKAKSKFKGLEDRITFVNANFKEIDEKKIDAIIFDLGLSSDQLENSGRGFSFMKDEPLLMTMKENPGLEDVTAYDIVNTWEEKNLADIIYGYGEERFSRRIAWVIVDGRQKK